MTAMVLRLTSSGMCQTPFSHPDFAAVEGERKNEYPYCDSKSIEFNVKISSHGRTRDEISSLLGTGGRVYSEHLCGPLDLLWHDLMTLVLRYTVPTGSLRYFTAFLDSVQLEKNGSFKSCEFMVNGNTGFVTRQPNCFTCLVASPRESAYVSVWGVPIMACL